MTNIQLTNKHKEMLLEMCNTLFLDQKPFCLGLPQELRKGWGYSKDYLFGKCDTYEGNGIIINWYEFVHTHLVEKILNPTPDKPCRNISGKFKDFFWESNCYWSELNSKIAFDDNEAITNIHPIEYLYNIYKQTN